MNVRYGVFCAIVSVFNVDITPNAPVTLVDLLFYYMVLVCAQHQPFIWYAAGENWGDMFFHLGIVYRASCVRG